MTAPVRKGSRPNSHAKQKVTRASSRSGRCGARSTTPESGAARIGSGCVKSVAGWSCRMVIVVLIGVGADHEQCACHGGLAIVEAPGLRLTTSFKGKFAREAESVGSLAPRHPGAAGAAGAAGETGAAGKTGDNGAASPQSTSLRGSGALWRQRQPVRLLDGMHDERASYFAHVR